MLRELGARQVLAINGGGRGGHCWLPFGKLAKLVERESLYFQVLTAIMLGVLLGHFYPELGEQMKPLGDAFMQTIKMIIAPIIFCTVVHGIASMQDMKKVGRVGLKALIYFEALTTLALIVGLIIANTLQPGAAMNVDASTIDTRAIQGFVVKSKEQSTIQFLMDIIPNTVVGAFAQGEILQVSAVSTHETDWVG
jgi:aerobic C4-dicarboxylate transport protein